MLEDFGLATVYQYESAPCVAHVERFVILI